MDVNEICTTLFKVQKDNVQKEWSRLQLPVSDARCATRRLFEMRFFASPSVTTSVLSGSLWWVTVVSTGLRSILTLQWSIVNPQVWIRQRSPITNQDPERQ